MEDQYPVWFFYPARETVPEWVRNMVGVAQAQTEIESRSVEVLTSQDMPGLVTLAYDVDAGKHRAEMVSRPALFGEQGQERVSYEVHAVHDEAGRPRRD